MTIALLASRAYGDTGEQRKSFAIRAGRASDSIAALASAADLDYFFCNLSAGDIVTNPAGGLLTPRDALNQMVAGTLLAFEIDEQRVIKVWRHDGAPCESSGSSDSGPQQPRQQEQRNRLATAPSQTLVQQRDPPPVEITGHRRQADNFVPQPSLTVSREQLDWGGGITLPAQLQSLPQTVDGGVTEENIRRGREGLTNGNHATGIDIHGVGAGGTLVLFNGHSTVEGGTDGMYTELDAFQKIGIQRIDLFTDGPPLEWGANAIGGTVNIVMNTQFVGRSTELESLGLSAEARHEFRMGQMQGWRWNDSHFEYAIELAQLDALPASARGQYTSDLTRLGGKDSRTPYSEPPTIVAGGVTYAVPVNWAGGQPTSSSLPANTENLTDPLEGTDIFPQQRRWNLYLEGDRQLADGVSASAESLCSYRKVTDDLGGYTAILTVDQSNPWYVNPAGGTGPIDVFRKFTRELGHEIETTGVTTCDSALAFDANDPAGWHFNASLAYGTERQQQVTPNRIDFGRMADALSGISVPAFDPFGDGSGVDPVTLKFFRSSSHYEFRNDQWDLQLHAERPLLSLWSRDLLIAAGSGFRTQTLAARTQDYGSAPVVSTDLSRHIASGFGRLTVPMPGHITVEAGGRFDHYNDFGGILSPEYAVTWAPSASFSIRGNWAELFRPPNMPQLVESNNVSQIALLPDNQAASGASAVLIDVGRNAHLKAERSRNWGIRLDLKPGTLPGFRTHLGYYHIDSQNRIEDLDFETNVLDDPAYRAFVIRNPSEAQRREICSYGQFAGTPADCLSSPIGAIVDLRTHNTSILTTSGVDFESAYGWSSAWGAFEADLTGTYIFDYSVAPTADSPKVQLRNTPNFPVALRIRPMLQWKLPRLTTMVAVNYRNAYRDAISIPNRDVASWTTVDMQVTYKVSGPNGWVDGMEFSLTAINLLGRNPPFLNNQYGVGYDLVNGNLNGRMIGVSLRVQW